MRNFYQNVKIDKKNHLTNEILAIFVSWSWYAMMKAVFGMFFSIKYRVLRFFYSNSFNELTLIVFICFFCIILLDRNNEIVVDLPVDIPTNTKAHFRRLNRCISRYIHLILFFYLLLHHNTMVQIKNCH